MRIFILAPAICQTNQMPQPAFSCRTCGGRDKKNTYTDQLHLLFLPFRPAIFAHLFTDLLPKLGRDRRVADRFALRAAPRALEFIAAK